MLSELLLSVPDDNGLLFVKVVSQDVDREPEIVELARLLIWPVLLRKLWDPNGLLDHEFSSVDDCWAGEDGGKKVDDDVEDGENLSLDEGEE